MSAEQTPEVPTSDDRMRKVIVLSAARTLKTTGRLTTDDIRRITQQTGQPGFDQAMALFGGKSVGPGRIAEQARLFLENAKQQRAQAPVNKSASPAVKQARATQAELIQKALLLINVEGLTVPLSIKQIDGFFLVGRMEPSREINDAFSLGGHDGIRVFNAILGEAQKSPERAAQIISELRANPMTKLIIHEKETRLTSSHKWTLDEVLDASLELLIEQRRFEPFEDTEVDHIAKTSRRLPPAGEIRKLASPNGFPGYKRLMRVRLDELRETRRNEPSDKFPETFAEELIKQNQIATGQLAVARQASPAKVPSRGKDNPFTADEIVEVSVAIMKEQGLERPLRWAEVQKISTTTRALPTPQTVNRKFEGGWKEYEQRVSAAAGLAQPAAAERVVVPKPVPSKPAPSKPVAAKPVATKPVAATAVVKREPPIPSSFTRAAVLSRAMSVVIERGLLLPLSENEVEELSSVEDFPDVAETKQLFSHRGKRSFLFFQRELAVMMNNRDLPGSEERTLFLQQLDNPKNAPETAAVRDARALAQAQIIESTMKVVRKYGLEQSPSSVDVQKFRYGSEMPNYRLIKDAFAPLGYPEFRRVVDKLIAAEKTTSVAPIEAVQTSNNLSSIEMSIGRDSLAS